MELKPGYKQTEVTVIPEDWTVSQLGTLAETSSGTTPARDMQDRYYRNGSIAWVKTMDLTNSEVITTLESVTELALKETSLRVYPVGTVLVAMYGGFQQIGRTGLLRIPAAVNQAITAIQPKADKLVSKYLLGMLNYRVDYWKSVASSSRKDPNITGQDIRNFPIAYPGPPEQRAIAAVLTDVDALISGLDQLIAKKRDFKQAAMQDLLTGQRRLPAFESEAGFKQTEVGVIPKDWEVAKLSAICSMKSGLGITSTNIDQFSEYPCYGGNGLRGYTKDFTHDGSYALIGRQGALCGNVLGVKGKFFASEHAIVVTSLAQTDILWLTIVLSRMRLNQYSESSAQPGLSVSKLMSLDLALPSTKTEQTAIATILTDMDAEIARLEQRRDKTHALKKGMMQELLTGKTRLV